MMQRAIRTRLCLFLATIAAAALILPGGCSAPRDKTAVLRKTLTQCARLLEKHGLAKEADLIRSSPAARLGRSGSAPPKSPLHSGKEKPVVADAIAQVLARGKAIKAAFAGKGGPPRSSDRARFVDMNISQSGFRVSRS